MGGAVEQARLGTVLVVDADAASRGRASAALDRAGYTAREIDSGVEALAAVETERPALVLTELQLGDMTGYELCHQLRESYGELLSVFLMSAERTESMDRVAGLMIGADDFIVKPFDADELVARVRRSIERNSARDGINENGGLDATPRERDVLFLLADGYDQQAIAEKLAISPKTVATHIQRLLVKFGAHSRAQLVALAYKRGLFD